MDTRDIITKEDIKLYQGLIEKNQGTYGTNPLAYLGQLLEDDGSEELNTSDKLNLFFSQVALVLSGENEKCSYFSSFFQKVGNMVIAGKVDKKESEQVIGEIKTLHQKFVEGYQNDFKTDPFEDLDALNSDKLPSSNHYHF